MINGLQFTRKTESIVRNKKKEVTESLKNDHTLFILTNRFFRAYKRYLFLSFLSAQVEQFKKSWYKNTGQSLYNAMFGIHRTGPCYKWTVL